MKYKLEQFPKNKDLDLSLMSNCQLLIRNNVLNNSFDFICVKCGKKLDKNEFYIKNKNTENPRRDKTCRDCRMKSAGVLNIGKQRFADKIGEKGFKKCSSCKEIKPLNFYSKNKSTHDGINKNCKECSKERLDEFQKKQRIEIGDFYIKQYKKRNNIKSDYEAINEIKEKRKIKHKLDGFDFYSTRQFADYIFKKHGILQKTTEARVSNGYNDLDCTLDSSSLRSKAQCKRRKNNPELCSK